MDLLATQVVQRFSRSGSRAEVWKVGARSSCFFSPCSVVGCFGSLSSSSSASYSDLSELINTSDGSYFARWRSMPLTKVDALITLAFLACPSRRCQILILLFLLMRFVGRPRPLEPLFGVFDLVAVWAY